MQNRMLTFAVACLLVVAAALLYLEWWRSGELEFLSKRVDDLEEPRRKRAARKSPAQEDTP